MIDHSFQYYGIVFYAIILARYFVIAGGIYLCLYFLPRPPVSPSRRRPSWRSIYHDIKLSVLSAGIFALAAAFILCAYGNHGTQLYADPWKYGLWYLGLSYGLVLLLQDTYFYFTHRLFHHPRLFPWVHQGHHRSRYPTPWTSFAFDPIEAIVQALFLVGVTFLIPLNFGVMIAVLTTMTVWAVLNHLAPDRLPLAFPHHWLGRWIIGPAHHSIHHAKYHSHYGLYFTFWDRWLGTQHPSYRAITLAKTAK
ncbi:MAG: sterol desaturase family protein [Cyanobacteria bacterium REEB459]|nr:sterol desaturase family protein [Cyanobacteria bacterium REEB459]